MDGDEKNTSRIRHLDVERLNIIDRNGTLRMTLFNAENFPDIVLGDKVHKRQIGSDAAGMLFYNSDGEECGGLVFGNGEAALLFDQYHQDQVIGLTYGQDIDGRNQYGLTLWDRPDLPLAQWMEEWSTITSMPAGEERSRKEALFKNSDRWSHHRATIGKSADGDLGVQLMDSKGNTRLRMVVDSQDVPRLEFLDETGEVYYRLPPEPDEPR